MYGTIQAALTFLIEAIALIGFIGIAIHAMWTAVQKEIANWGTPKPNSQPTQKAANEAIIPTTQPEASKLTEMPTVIDPWDTPITTSNPRWGIPKSNERLLPLMLPPAKQRENQKNSAPSFPSVQGYSKNRLRKIAKELKIKRYTRMERPELITAISTHPTAIKYCC